LTLGFWAAPHLKANSSLVSLIKDLHFRHLRVLLVLEYLQR